MPDRSWKAFERRCCRALGTVRIPSTGARHGADGETSSWCLQFKLRRSLPAWLFEWSSGITATAARRGKRGALVIKQPRMLDADALVIVRFCDFVEMQQVAEPNNDAP